MQWSYDVKGVLPQYSPPRGKSAQPMAGPHPDPRFRGDKLNYIRENLRLSTTAASSPIKGAPLLTRSLKLWVLLPGWTFQGILILYHSTCCLSEPQFLGVIRNTRVLLILYSSRNVSVRPRNSRFWNYCINSLRITFVVEFVLEYCHNIKYKMWNYWSSRVLRPKVLWYKHEHWCQVFIQIFLCISMSVFCKFYF